MELDWGAFGAGLRGENVGEFKRSRSDEERRKKEEERDDAYRKDMEGIPSPDDAYKAKQAEYEKSRKSSEVDSSSAVTAARVVANPAAQGFSLPTARPEPATFADSVAQRAQDGVLTAAAKPSAPQSIIAANGIGAASAMRQEIAKPEPVVSQEAPKAPGMNDWLEFATKRAAIDVKHGKLNGLGMMQLAQARKQLMDEGVDEAVMKFQQGDAAGGLESFNASGKYVGAKLVGEPQRGEFDYNGVKMPTTIVTLQLPNGRTETINTAQYGSARIKAENQFSAAMDILKHKDSKTHQDAVLKNQATEIGIRQSEHKEKRADTKKQKAEAIEKVNAAVAIHKERNPNATPAQIEAVRRGVMEAIPKEAKNEYSSIVDQFGNTVTRTNKDTGAVDIIDVKKGAVKLSMPAPGARPGGAPAQAAPPPEKREIGKAYQTPRGMMIWRGNGWSAN